MNTLSTAPIGTLFTCQYTSSSPKFADKPSYLIAGIVVKGYNDSKSWKPLLGGWNHIPGDTYGFPTPSSRADYTDVQTYSIDTFPYPELLI